MENWPFLPPGGQWECSDNGFEKNAFQMNMKPGRYKTALMVFFVFSPFFILPSCETAVNSKISSHVHHIHHVLYSRCSQPHFSDRICSFDWSWLESRQGLHESSLLLYKASAVAQRDRKSCLLLIIGGERTLHWQAQSWASQLSSQVQKQ